MKPKYEIKDRLYFQGCRREYQEENIFIPKFIEKRVTTWEDEEGIEHNYVSFSYSENGFSWYPENTLTDVLSDI